MLFTTFTKELWNCYQAQIDTDLNEVGWGYDITLSDNCNATIGLIDHEYMDHPAAGDAHTYSTNKAMQQMHAWLQLHLPMNYDLVQFATTKRPPTLPYCRDADFVAVIGSNEPMQFDSRKDTATDASNDAYLDLVPGSPKYRQQARSIHLVESVEEMLTFNALMDKWVGKSHAVTLNRTMWESPNFAASAPHCIAVFAFTSTMTNTTAQQLKEIGMHNISVCTAHHPIQRMIPGQSLDWKTALARKGSTAAALVMWDSGPDNQEDSLQELDTKRPKIVLTRATGTSNAANDHTAANQRLRDLRATQVQQMLLPPDEYDAIVSRNIVLVDTSANGLYEAAIWALELQSPIIMHKLDGFVKYLGVDYPLFFSELEEVQGWLNDEDLLLSKLLEARHYLQARDTSDFTPENWSRQVTDCTLQGMAHWPHD